MSRRRRERTGPGAARAELQAARGHRCAPGCPRGGEHPADVACDRTDPQCPRDPVCEADGLRMDRWLRARGCRWHVLCAPPGEPTLRGPRSAPTT